MGLNAGIRIEYSHEKPSGWVPYNQLTGLVESSQVRPRKHHKPLATEILYAELVKTVVVSPG